MGIMVKVIVLAITDISASVNPRGVMNFQTSSSVRPLVNINGPGRKLWLKRNFCLLGKIQLTQTKSWEKLMDCPHEITLSVTRSKLRLYCSAAKVRGHQCSSG